MDTLAYFHLASAYETSVNAETVPNQGSSYQGFEKLNWNKVPTAFWIQLLSVAAILGILGAAHQVMALEYGDRSGDVVVLQKKLKHLGYFDGPITGYYGPITTHAVKNYQEDVGLPAIGIAGPRTHAALGLAYESRYSDCDYPDRVVYRSASYQTYRPRKKYYRAHRYYHKYGRQAGRSHWRAAKTY